MFPRGLAVSGSYAYVGCDSEGLRIISVADPTQPEDVAHYDMPGITYDVEVVGDYVYVANLFDGLRILSVADPVHPVEVGYLPGNPVRMAVDGDYACVSDAVSGFLQVFSIADPVHPVEVGRLAGVGGEVEMAGSYAYVLHINQAMLYVVSIADPTHPVEVGHYALDPQFWALDAGRGYVYAGSYDGYWILEFYVPGDIDVDNDSLDVVADTIRLRGSGSYGLGQFVLANTSASYNPDTADGPSLSVLDSVHFSGSLSGPGGTLDSILIPNLPTFLAEGQVIICSLVVFTPPGLRDGDYTGLVTIAGKDTAGFVIADTFYARLTKLGDLDVDDDSLDVVADTIRLRPRELACSPGTRSESSDDSVMSVAAIGEFVLVNTSASYNPDTTDGPSRSPVDSINSTGVLSGPGGTIDSVIIQNLPGSLGQGQTVTCTLAVYVPDSLPDGDYSGPISFRGYDSLHYEIAETVYALLRKVSPAVAIGDLDVADESLDVSGGAMDLHTQPAGPVYSPYAKARFMLVNTSQSYNPDTMDGPSRSPLREVKVEAKVEAQGGSVDSVYVLNLPESLAVGEAVECTLALVLPVGTQLDGYTGWVTIKALDTLGFEVRDSFVLRVSGPSPRQNLDSLRVAPIPFKPYQMGHDAIHFQGLTSGAKVVVYDASGQSIWSATESGDGHLKWDAKVASGIYVYLVVAKDGESRVGKLSVIR
jgi:hypothetical protein